MNARMRTGAQERILAGNVVKVLQMTVPMATTPREVWQSYETSIVEFSVGDGFAVYWAHWSDFGVSERDIMRTALRERVTQIESVERDRKKYLDNWIVRVMDDGEVEESHTSTNEEAAWDKYWGSIAERRDEKLWCGTIDILRQLDLGKPPRKFQRLAHALVQEGKVVSSTNTLSVGRPDGEDLPF